MELIQPDSEQNKLDFKGDGPTFFGIVLLNWFLTALTAGLYYPWARVAKLRYIYQNTELNGTPFIFHGTGMELFKGFVKVFLLIAAFWGLMIYGAVTNSQAILAISYLTFGLVVAFIIPLALHSAMRYRLSRTSWRGIHLGYRGERGHLFLEFIFGYVLMFFTFGIYYSWFATKLRTYVIGNIRFGNLKAGYDGTGGELFIINLKGLFLSYLTLGIYYFWYRAEWINHYMDHIYLVQGENKYYFKGRVKGGQMFGLLITNFLLTVFTLGLALPWVIIRTMRFMISNMEVAPGVNFDRIAQTEDDYRDATGEDVLDAFDIGIV